MARMLSRIGAPSRLLAGLGCQGNGYYGVVGLLDVRHVGKAAVLVDEGAIPGLGCLAFRGGLASGAVHSGQMLRAYGFYQAEPLCSVAEGEVVVEAAVDGFLYKRQRDGLRGDDDEGLGVVGGAFLQLGQEGILL